MDEASDFRRILLIKPSSLGDMVHALPVLHGLRERFPKAHLAWLVFKSFAPLIQGHPELDEVIEFDRVRFRRVGRSLGVTREFLAFAHDLRDRGFDLVVDLQGLFRSGFLAWASGARTRIGFRSAREFAWIFYTHKLATPDPDMHAVDKNYLVAHVLGFDHVPVTFNLGLTDSERSRGAQALVDAGLSPDDPFVAVLPGARWETKRWLPERFAAVIRGLAGQHGLRSVLLGSPPERELCTQIGDSADPATPVNLAGAAGLRDTLAILERSAAVICHDSAPAHFGAALGRPVVCIVGPTNSSRTGPYASDARIIGADLPCSPCYFRSLAQCPHNHECMRRIAADPVVAAVVEVATSHDE